MNNILSLLYFEESIMEDNEFDAVFKKNEEALQYCILSILWGSKSKNNTNPLSILKLFSENADLLKTKINSFIDSAVDSFKQQVTDLCNGCNVESSVLQQPSNGKQSEKLQ
jgi:hypothetical protein